MRRCIFISFIAFSIADIFIEYNAFAGWGTEINFYGQRSGQGVWPMKIDFRVGGGKWKTIRGVKIIICYLILIDNSIIKNIA